MLNRRFYMACLTILISLCISMAPSFFKKQECLKLLTGSVIRFHVLANSDTAKDQALKMKVKNVVVDYINENSNATSLDEMRDFLTESKNTIVDLAKDVVKSNGYDYGVSACLKYDDFPDKTYGDVVFPAGTYESFTISIGKAKGHNWWCVLYPPLCFVDDSTGVLPDESKDMLKEEIGDAAYSCLNKKSQVTVRFKYLTFLNELFD